MTEGLPPSPEDLGPDDLQAIINGDIILIEQIGDEWTDDGIKCVAVRVTVSGHRPIDTTLWWCGPDIICALKFWADSPKTSTHR